MLSRKKSGSRGHKLVNTTNSSAGNQPANHIITASWTGPLPPPQALQQFDNIIPGGAERILAMAEQQQSARIAYEQTVLNASVKEASRGQWLGSLISLSSVLGAIALAIIGITSKAHAVFYGVSVALLGVPLMALGKAIVDSRSHKQK
ncbi:MAG: DUF2335 domain-containing protein [Acidithiobacillus ferriphilus]|uniref:DUF2335 domain-containing protein n=1 Tax=Acidithiobacillus ferriphilus TaxID=1689834 RepID=UPI002430C407|nr:DUF2335 domain-containing protein [Acidithiobacillus ferriphilus]MBW9248630.1 DUF2335 domain-containing protein [Acidithiobacillus ferriphilus]MBW9255205.1 DUF2335 domain-containing protein [Acidithiobacillus ferriphilus]